MQHMHGTLMLEIQKTIVELTLLHTKNQAELKDKLSGLVTGKIKTKKMLHLTNIVSQQKAALKELTTSYDKTKSSHINHKNMLKDTFYIDLENLKRKYHNDNSKLQELLKINTNELVKKVQENGVELRLNYVGGE